MADQHSDPSLEWRDFDFAVCLDLDLTIQRIAHLAAIMRAGTLSDVQMTAVLDCIDVECGSALESSAVVRSALRDSWRVCSRLVSNEVAHG